MHVVPDGRSIWMKPTVLNAAIDYFHSTDGLISKSDHILSYQLKQRVGYSRFYVIAHNSTCPKTGQILGISVKIPQGKAVWSDYQGGK